MLATTKTGIVLGDDNDRVLAVANGEEMQPNGNDAIASRRTTTLQPLTTASTRKRGNIDMDAKRHKEEEGEEARIIGDSTGGSSLRHGGENRDAGAVSSSVPRSHIDEHHSKRSESEENGGSAAATGKIGRAADTISNDALLLSQGIFGAFGRGFVLLAAAAFIASVISNWLTQRQQLQSMTQSTSSSPTPPGIRYREPGSQSTDSKYVNTPHLVNADKDQTPLRHVGQASRRERAKKLLSATTGANIATSDESLAYSPPPAHPGAPSLRPHREVKKHKVQTGLVPPAKSAAKKSPPTITQSRASSADASSEAGAVAANSMDPVPSKSANLDARVPTTLPVLRRRHTTSSPRQERPQRDNSSLTSEFATQHCANDTPDVALPNQSKPPETLPLPCHPQRPKTKKTKNKKRTPDHGVYSSVPSSLSSFDAKQGGMKQIISVSPNRASLFDPPRYRVPPLREGGVGLGGGRDGSGGDGGGEGVGSLHLEAMRALRVAQDEAFAQSMAADLAAREQARQEAEKRSLATNTDVTAASDGHYTEVSANIRNAMPPEPSANDTADIVTVMIRLPKGQSFRRRFRASVPLQTVTDFAASLGCPPTSHILFTAFPRRALTSLGPESRTLGEVAGPRARLSLYAEEL